jgi:arylsulfatase A-like enzyme
MRVEERPVAVADLLATICEALGIDYRKQNMSNTGRPIRIVDATGTPIREALT